MKALVNKLLAFTFVIALFSGCASVTDAGMHPQPEQSDTNITKQQPADTGFSSEQDMSPIVPKPR